MEFKKREYLIFYCAIGLLAVWLISKVIFTPFHVKLADISSQVTVQEAKLKKGLNLVAKKKEISQEYDKYASYFSLHGLSEEEAVANFLKEVEKISRASGITISDMKPQKESKSDKFSRQYQIQIKAEADIKELVNFLYSLHTSALLFSVEKILLVPKAEDSPDLSIAMTVIGVSFL